MRKTTVKLIVVCSMLCLMLSSCGDNRGENGTLRISPIQGSQQEKVSSEVLGEASPEQLSSVEVGGVKSSSAAENDDGKEGQQVASDNATISQANQSDHPTSEGVKEEAEEVDEVSSGWGEDERCGCSACRWWLEEEKKSWEALSQEEQKLLEEESVVKEDKAKELTETLSKIVETARLAVEEAEEDTNNWKVQKIAIDAVKEAIATSIKASRAIEHARQAAFHNGFRDDRLIKKWGRKVHRLLEEVKELQNRVAVLSSPQEGEVARIRIELEEAQRAAEIALAAQDLEKKKWHVTNVGK